MIVATPDSELFHFFVRDAKLAIKRLTAQIINVLLCYTYVAVYKSGIYEYSKSLICSRFNLSPE